MKFFYEVTLTQDGKEFKETFYTNNGDQAIKKAMKKFPKATIVDTNRVKP